MQVQAREKRPAAGWLLFLPFSSLVSQMNTAVFLKTEMSVDFDKIVILFPGSSCVCLSNSERIPQSAVKQSQHSHPSIKIDGVRRSRVRWHQWKHVRRYASKGVNSAIKRRSCNNQEIARVPEFNWDKYSTIKSASLINLQAKHAMNTC